MQSLGQNCQLSLEKNLFPQLCREEPVLFGMFPSQPRLRWGKWLQMKQTTYQIKYTNSHFFPSMFSDTVQACGTTSMSWCVSALSPPSEELLLIPSLSIPSHSPALGGSGKIPETVSWDQQGAGPGWGQGVWAKEESQGSVTRMSGSHTSTRVEGGWWYIWRLEGMKASTQ